MLFSCSECGTTKSGSKPPRGWHKDQGEDGESPQLVCSACKTLVTNTYVYGAHCPSDLEEVERQFRLAHEYRNARVALELSRRDRVNTLLVRLAPDLFRVEQEIGVAAEPADPELGLPATPATGATLRLELALAACARARVNQNPARPAGRRGGRAAPPAELQAEVRAARDQLRRLRAQRQILRTALFADMSEPQATYDAWVNEGGNATTPRPLGWRAEQAALNEWFNTEVKRLRADYSARGLYWGSYLLVEDTVKKFHTGRPPRFRNWSRRKDRLGVQLQQGLSPTSLMTGESKHLGLTTTSRPDGSGRRGDRVLRGVLNIRIGTTEQNTPRFITVPIVYHRPLPPDGVIKWCYLTRRTVGSRVKWRVHLIVSTPPTEPVTAPAAAVGVDVGWRMRPDGSLRVAVTAGSDGRELELALPPWWLAEQHKCRRIQSERDRLFDAARDHAQALIRSGAAPPEWTGRDEDIRWMATWRSPKRLVTLLRRWGEVGYADPQLVAWQRRDRHLWDYQMLLQDQLAGSRLDLYRCFARRMRRCYNHIVIEDLDLREFHVRKGPDEAETPEDDAKRAYVRYAALSVLVDALTQAFNVARSVTIRDGANLTRVDPAATTTICHACGHNDSSWTDHAGVDHTCPNCGLRWDQDVNAARNLLGANGNMVAWSRPPLAPNDIMSYVKRPPNVAMRARGNRRGARNETQ